MKLMIRNLIARLSWGRKLLDYRANLKKLEGLNQQNVLAVDYIEQMFLRLLPVRLIPHCMRLLNQRGDLLFLLPHMEREYTQSIWSL